MLTDPIRTQINQIWNALWPGGDSTPLAVIQQLISIDCRVNDAAKVVG